MSENETTLPNEVVLLPQGWVPLAPAGQDPGEWVETYIDGLGATVGPAAREQLRHGLLAVIDMAAGMRPGNRYSFALIEDPSTGLVRSLLSVQMLHVKGNAFENYRARLESSTDPETTEVINRTIQQITFPVGTAWLLHDFTLAAEQQAVAEPALERGILGLFLSDRDVLIEFSMYAQDLAVFDNMAQYLVDVASTFTLSENSA